MKNNKRIFIIDHERIVGLDLQLQLKKNGYSVHRPISLIDTENILSEEVPDFVIADTDIKKTERI